MSKIIENIVIEDISNTHLAEAGDGQEWGRRDCHYTSHHIVGFRTSKTYSNITVPFRTKMHTPYYLLYCLYRTGDSFGYDEGNIEYINLYKDRELAEFNKRLIEQHYKKYEDSHEFNDDRFSVQLFLTAKRPYKLHCPWIGYFEALEDVVIDRIYKSEG
jgi:hypothetical protein